MIGSRTSVVLDSLHECSLFYQKVRDESGEGASSFPVGRIVGGPEKGLVISYNGRIWRKWSSYSPELVQEAAKLTS